LTSNCSARRSAQSSAAAAGPTISTWPADLNSTAGAGSASGSAAIATSAAIFGIVLLRSPDQPACSRTLTNCSFDCEPALAASSPNNAASWVQATITSVSPSAVWKAFATRRQSWSCTCNGAFSLSAEASAFASSATVRLQLQTLSVLPSRLIVLLFDLVCQLVFRPVFRLLFGRLLRLSLRFLRFMLLVEQQNLRLVERRQHLGRNRVGDIPVPGIRLEGVGNVEMRMTAEQLLQRRATQIVLDLGLHEPGEVRFARERLDRRQRLRFRRRRRLLFLDRLLRRLFRGKLVLVLEARPAAKEILGHRYVRSLGCRKDRGLMRFCGSGR